MQDNERMYDDDPADILCVCSDDDGFDDYDEERRYQNEIRDVLREEKRRRHNEMRQAQKREYVRSLAPHNGRKLIVRCTILPEILAYASLDRETFLRSLEGKSLLCAILESSDGKKSTYCKDVTGHAEQALDEFFTDQWENGRSNDEEAIRGSLLHFDNIREDEIWTETMTYGEREIEHFLKLTDDDDFLDVCDVFKKIFYEGRYRQTFEHDNCYTDEDCYSSDYIQFGDRFFTNYNDNNTAVQEGFVFLESFKHGISKYRVTHFGGFYDKQYVEHNIYPEYVITLKKERGNLTIMLTAGDEHTEKIHKMFGNYLRQGQDMVWFLMEYLTYYRDLIKVIGLLYLTEHKMGRLRQKRKAYDMLLRARLQETRDERIERIREESRVMYSAQNKRYEPTEDEIRQKIEQLAQMYREQRKEFDDVPF